MTRATVSAAPGTLRMSIAAGSLAGWVAAAHDVLLRSGDLTGEAATFATRGAVALSAYVLIASIVAIPLVLIARRFVADEEAPGEGQPAVWAWWLAVAALAAVALALPTGGEQSALTLSGYAALIPIALLGIRALSITARSGVEVPGIAGLFAGGVVGAPTAFAAARLTNSTLPVPEVLNGPVIVASAVVAAFVAMIVVRAVLGWLSGRIGSRRAVGAAVAFALLPVVVAAGIGVADELARPRFSDALAALNDAQGTASARPSVVLISVDTLRADAVGYAGGAARTPAIDALAEKSWVFENAHSVAPWTRPSFASFFSGRYPSEMGVARAHSLYGELEVIIPYVWRDDSPLLAELLHDEGYVTGAEVGNPNLDRAAGVDRGFDAFHNFKNWGPPHFSLHRIGYGLDLLLAAMGSPLPDAADFERAHVIAQGGAQLLEALSRSEAPTLTWMHFMDPHGPYDSPDAGPGEVADMDVVQVMGGWAVGGAAERTRWQGAYVAEIDYLDKWFGQVMEALEETGAWDNSIVVFWSDHGEEFWEHRGWGHGQALYDDLLHVPLLIHLPGQTEGRRVTEQVSLLDVTPTLLDLCGVQRPEEMHGRSLKPIFEGRPDAIEPLSVYLEGCLYGGIQKGLLRGRYKLIHDLYSDSYELYDIEADPTEHVNLYGAPGAPDVAGMRTDLAAFTEQSLATMEAYAGRQADELPQDVLDSLRDMGYIQ